MVTEYRSMLDFFWTTVGAVNDFMIHSTSTSGVNSRSILMGRTWLSKRDAMAEAYAGG